MGHRVGRIDRLAVENLESRLNLSTGAALASAPDVLDRASALGVTGAGTQVSTLTATQAAKVQSLPSLPTEIVSRPPTGPVSLSRYIQTWQKSKPTPSPTPTPAPSLTYTTDPVSISSVNMTSFTQLVITGTAGNDSINVTQSGATITITANGQTYTQSGGFVQIAVYGAAGDDAITIASSVNLETLLYGGDGADTIKGEASARTTIVTIGGGIDTVLGNGVNTSFWTDGADKVTASSAEISAGRVHTVSSFYQPFTTNAASVDYVSLELSGQNLRDPAGGSITTRLQNRSLWGTGPAATDVRQGSVGDCYYLASIGALANQSPDRLRELAVDLGDGSYAVQFTRSGVKSFVRVDGDLATYGGSSLMYARPGASGNLWAPIMEKAYAFFRTSGQNSYASLSSGWMGAALNDLGVASKTFYTSADAQTLYNTVSVALAAGKAFTVATNNSVSGAPVVASHAYMVVGVNKDILGNITFTLRNPWGYDGAGNDGNTADGLVTLTMAQLKANFGYGSYAA